MSSPPVGLLLTNLGTPDAPDSGAVRRYLAEFLWDRRVVDLPRPLWWLILHGIVLRFRPARSAQGYRRIWWEEGSPLLVIAKKQCDQVTAALQQRYPEQVVVALGMRYGNPSIAGALQSLREQGVERLLVLPLYPQNSCSTTASTFDAVAQELSNWRRVPALRFIDHYSDYLPYLRALANSIEEQWRLRPAGERLLFSFHGTPQRYSDEGDPYYEQCCETAKRVAQLLAVDEGAWLVSFQSRVGREEWLKPYTDETIQRLAAEGVKRLDVISPTFSADCLETLDEIAVEYRHQFIDAGGEEFHYIPALNVRNDHIEALVQLAEENFTGWIDM